MNIQELHSNPPRPGHWPHCMVQDLPGMDAMLDLLDAEFNSERGALLLYDTLQRGHDKPTGSAMRHYPERVRLAIHRNGDIVGTSVHTIRLLTYALLARWITADRDPYIISGGDTYRSSCGYGRATYNPEWSASKPWTVVVCGTVINHLPTFDMARELLRTKGCAIS